MKMTDVIKINSLNMRNEYLYHCKGTAALFVEAIDMNDEEVTVKELNSGEIKKFSLMDFRECFAYLTPDYLNTLKRIAGKQKNDGWLNKLNQVESLLSGYKLRTGMYEYSSISHEKIEQNNFLVVDPRANLFNE
ncbi:hypothetical protein MOF23_22280 [Bacillus inaquosorum]|uniref:hypothetical protein n=1 Tax=Bacillus inaquosorum TaxID=483913 RepID=UPI00228009A9|nr:hypothetical protein [Bacillus inaquosorum]MCY9311662.1 hypothetical protein [Bacillus inaquosorum]